MEQARRRYVKVLGGFDNRLMDHPLLLMLLLVIVVSLGSGAMGALAGAKAVNKATETMIANSVRASTQVVEEKMNKVEEQTKDLNQTVEDAQLWRAMTDGMYFQQKMDFIKQARQKAEQARRSRGMPTSMPAIDKVR